MVMIYHSTVRLMSNQNYWTTTTLTFAVLFNKHLVTALNGNTILPFEMPICNLSTMCLIILFIINTFFLNVLPTIV